MLERHPEPIPGICDVCRYAMDEGLDNESEHALTRLATLLLIHDLEEMGGGPLRLSGLAVSIFPPVDQGPQHPIAPRHWFWAIFHEPDVQLVLRRDRT